MDAYSGHWRSNKNISKILAKCFMCLFYTYNYSCVSKDTENISYYSFKCENWN